MWQLLKLIICLLYHWPPEWRNSLGLIFMHNLANGLQTAFTSALLIFKGRLILVFEKNNCMAEKATYLMWWIEQCVCSDFISHCLSRGSIYYISRILQGAGCVSDHGDLRRLEAIKCHFWSLLNKCLRQRFVVLSGKFMFSGDCFLGGLGPVRKIKYIHANGGKWILQYKKILLSNCKALINQ